MVDPAPGLHPLALTACSQRALISSHVPGLQAGKPESESGPQMACIWPTLCLKKKVKISFQHLKTTKLYIKIQTSYFSRKNNKRTWQSWAHIPMRQELARAEQALPPLEGAGVLHFPAVPTQPASLISFSARPL